MTDNAIVHFDISGPEEDALRSFYAELLGWKVDPQGPGYALVDTPGGLRGSLIEAEAAQVTIGVGVPDLNKALGDAERLGGTTVMSATDNGWVLKGQVRDPSGNL